MKGKKKLGGARPGSGRKPREVKKQAVIAYLEPEQAERLRGAAAASGKSTSAFVTEAIEYLLNQKDMKRYEESDVYEGVATFNADPFSVEGDDVIADVLEELNKNPYEVRTEENTPREEWRTLLAKLDLSERNFPKRIITTHNMSICLPEDFVFPEDEIEYGGHSVAVREDDENWYVYFRTGLGEGIYPKDSFSLKEALENQANLYKR